MTAIVYGEVARGERVVLREKRLSDAAEDFRWRSDAELARYDAARPFAGTYSDYLAIFEDELRSPSQDRRSFSIDDLHGRHIGNVMFYNVDRVRREVEIGITIGERAYWGHGYGSDAVRAFVRYLIERMGFQRVHLKTLEWNHRAQRAFMKAGFRVVARVRRGTASFYLMEFLRDWLDQDGAPAAVAGDDSSVTPA